MNGEWRNHILTFTLCGCAGVVVFTMSAALVWGVVTADQYLGFAGMVIGGFLALLRIGQRGGDRPGGSNAVSAGSVDQSPPNRP